MPYNSIHDLPDSVRSHVPQHAQEIYRAAFNNALKEYGANDEAQAHRVAWAAVKNEYEKDEKSGQWHRKAENAKR